MPKQQYPNIEAVIEELEPDKRYILFIDKRFLDTDDMQLLAEMLARRNEKNTLAVIGEGDPQTMTSFIGSDNWGVATINLQDYSFAMAWPLPSLVGISIKDFDSYAWERSMIDFFVTKVKETGMSMRLKQEELKGETNAAQ